LALSVVYFSGIVSGVDNETPGHGMEYQGFPNLSCAMLCLLGYWMGKYHFVNSWPDRFENLFIIVLIIFHLFSVYLLGIHSKKKAN